MRFCSMVFAFGAWHIDRSYMRRKFRVIFALNDLMEELAANSGDLSKVSTKLLKVAGDNAEMPFDCAGYRQARTAELAIYLLPLVILIVGIALVFSQLSRG
jgi:hypothetical protein